MLRLLVADDHEIVRRGLQALLKTQPGWEVSAEAVDGRDAVEKAKVLRPDIVIMDLAMPELNGLEATRQIRKILPDTEVIILTMHESEQVVREVLDAGARGYILKSDAGRDLIAAVESVNRKVPFFTSKVAALVLDAYLNGRGGSGSEDRRRLSPREREILQMLAEGRSSKEVAIKLGISVKSAETHRSNIMRKLDLHSISDLVRYAIRNKIVEP